MRHGSVVKEETMIGRGAVVGKETAAMIAENEATDVEETARIEMIVAGETAETVMTVAVATAHVPMTVNGAIDHLTVVARGTLK
jgi:hypothetical protein